MADGGQPLGAPGAAQGDTRFGDIRVGAKPMAAASVANAVLFNWTGSTWAGDVLLNNTYSFGTSGSGSYDLYTIALHELGHSFGLDDNQTDTRAVMYDTYSGPRTGLGGSDVNAVRALYGARAPDAFDAPSGIEVHATLGLRGVGGVTPPGCAGRARVAGTTDKRVAGAAATARGLAGDQ